MTTFKVLQLLVLSYSGFVALFSMFILFFEIKNGFRPVKAGSEMFLLLNKLHGKVNILLPFRILSVAFMLCWLILALPWVDTFIGTHLISHWGSEPGAIVTWIGSFTSKQADYYFITVFVSMLGAKGYFLCKRMADILTNDKLAISVMGYWGGRRKDFKR